MDTSIHRFFILFLIVVGVLAVFTILVRNYDYYALPDEERPYHERYDQVKPSGVESHGYGIIGTAMITIGVITYSTRKRVKAFGQIGKIRYFLEFHIFLCLLGPLLVLYHTTFKFGGIVAVSFWSMAAVASSGIVGRYLYVQIPKGIQGDELDIRELEEHNRILKETLSHQFGLDDIDLKKIDSLAVPRKGTASLFTLLLFFIIGDLTMRSRLRRIITHLHARSVDAAIARNVVRIAAERIRLTRRIQFLEQLKGYFHYWHVIHLPFTFIMFIILAVHIAVAVLFGYTWIF
ncbi:MAG: hypothetical protein HUU02_08535 [Bacteroidetes bacterium]|nr:hypothetical protein [Bacteroidota bacterium]